MTLPEIIEIDTDILIIGGGTAGCMAAILAKGKAPHLSVTILEKANIKRSGCLAMGLNAVNAHLFDTDPQAYLEFVKNDNYGLVRSDLVHSIGKRLNRMTRLLESLGVPFLKADDGNYIPRSNRSIVMLGEQIKPLLSEAVQSEGVTVCNRTPAYRLILDDEGKSVTGALGYNIRSGELIFVKAAAVLVCTGGASGIYHPSNSSLARTKTWYCPYNAGSGLSMGLRAGAEMTSFEMRFVALRTKDVMAPTGTLVLEMETDTPLCNALGEQYIKNRENMLGRNLTTSERLLFTIQEHKKGVGPCYIDVSVLDKEQYCKLIESYLNMAPSFVLDLLEDPERPRTHIEVCGSEPYINGGHGMAGYWIDENRKTTLERLYAAGDVAGGSPKKYVTGCFAEAEIAVEDIVNTLFSSPPPPPPDRSTLHRAALDIMTPLHTDGDVTFNDIEERLQKIMEEYAGGSTQNYETSRDKLMLAQKYLQSLTERFRDVGADDPHCLMRVHDTIDRVLLARVLVAHLLERKETRWPCYQTRLDYPDRNDLEYRIFINSRLMNNEIQMIHRSAEHPYSEL